jgi:hypothetical protein
VGLWACDLMTAAHRLTGPRPPPPAPSRMSHFIDPDRHFINYSTEPLNKKSVLASFMTLYCRDVLSDMVSACVVHIIQYFVVTSPTIQHFKSRYTSTNLNPSHSNYTGFATTTFRSDICCFMAVGVRSMISLRPRSSAERKAVSCLRGSCSQMSLLSRALVVSSA